MPGQDRTGPLGQGARTGRGLGPCGNNAFVGGRNRGFFGRGFGRGGGFGRGFGRGIANFFGFNRTPVYNQSEDLKNYVSDLEAELKEAKETLKNLKDDTNE